jgi:tetratricopeptide (TPR) repeat protein
MLRGDYAHAVQAYKEVRKRYPDSPSGMIGLGLAYHLTGQLEEAHAQYAEFTYLFEHIFPSVVFKISQFEYMIELGCSTAPPKWEEIYRYPLMNEL